MKEIIEITPTEIMYNTTVGRYQIRYEYVEEETTEQAFNHYTGRPSIADNNRRAKSKSVYTRPVTRQRLLAKIVDVTKEAAGEVYAAARDADQIFNLERNDENGDKVVRLKYTPKNWKSRVVPNAS